MGDSQPVQKKKSSNSYKGSINKLQKSLHPDLRISSNANEQLADIARVLAERLCTDAKRICREGEKTTIRDSEILLAFDLLSGGSYDQVHEFVERSICEFSGSTTSSENPQRREGRAGLKISVSLSEKFIRSFGESTIKVFQHAPVALAAIIEYIITRILNGAQEHLAQKKVKTFDVRQISLTMKENEDLRMLSNALGLELLGGGVLPGIREKLLEKRPATKKKAAKEAEDGTVASDDTKKRRFRPGTQSLRNIKKYQNTTDLLLRASPFDRDVRKIAEAHRDGVRFGDKVITALQNFVEQQTTKLLANALDITLHAKRDGVNKDDVILAWKLTAGYLPISLESKFTEISDNGIDRLAFRGGVKRKDAEMHSVVRAYIHSLVEAVVSRALSLIQHRGVVTVQMSDIKAAIRCLGINFITPERVI